MYGSDHGADDGVNFEFANFALFDGSGNVFMQVGDARQIFFSTRIGVGACLLVSGEFYQAEPLVCGKDFDECFQAGRKKISHRQAVRAMLLEFGEK